MTRRKASPSYGEVRRMVLQALAPPGSSTLPEMVQYTGTKRFLVPADGVWRTLDPVNLALPAFIPPSGRLRLTLEAWLTMTATARLNVGVTPGRAVTSVVTTQGSTTITAPSDSFTSADTGKRINGMGRSVSITTTSGSPSITGAASTFTADDDGRKISGAGIPAGTTLLYVSGTAATLRNAAGDADVNATASATVFSHIDTGLVAGATITVVDDTEATLSTPAVADGTITVALDDFAAEYGSQDMVNSQINGLVSASSIVSGLGTEVTRTLMWRARCFSGTPPLLGDGANVRYMNMAAFSLA